jgi:hypothetical protein
MRAVKSQVSARVCRAGGTGRQNSRGRVGGPVGAVGCSIAVDARSRRMSREVGALAVGVAVIAVGSRRIVVETVLYLGARGRWDALVGIGDDAFRGFRTYDTFWSLLLLYSTAVTVSLIQYWDGARQGARAVSTLAHLNYASLALALEVDTDTLGRGHDRK